MHASIHNFASAAAKRLCLALCVFAAWAACAAAGAAERHAVVVGVSSYTNLPPFLHLKGPTNDVRLVSSMLQENGFDAERITMLATGVEGASEPTRAAVLGALDALTKRVSRDDFVFLYLAGHGSQQPATSPDEPDALDEIFLPSDIGKWSGARQRVANAITDNELGERITRLRNRGAFVWAVFDTCHSGTLTRDGVAGEQLRAIDAVRYLGVPPAAEAKQADTDSETPTLVELEPDAGELVAMYASQSNERTPELDLPPGTDNRTRHGLFTFNLVEAVNQSGTLTYRQLAQRLYAGYTAMNRQRPTPAFEGNGIDFELFGDRSRAATRQWPLDTSGRRWALDAGRLHGLTPGTVVGLFDPSKDATALGYARVKTATLTGAQLEPVRYGGMKAPSRRKALPTGTVARIEEPAIDLRSRIALPDLSTLPTQDAAAMRAVLDLAAADKRLRPSIELVDTTDTAQVRMALRGSRLYLEPASGRSIDPGATVTIGIDGPRERVATNLVATLNRIDRSLGLLSVSRYVRGDRKLIELTVSRRSRGNDRRQPLNTGRVTVLEDGDEVQFLLHNDSGLAVDTTILYVDSQFRITPIYPARAGDLNRLEPGARDVVAGIVDTSVTAGREAIVMITVPARPNAPHTDFSFLAENGLPATDDVRGSEAGLPGVLRRLGGGLNNTRGGWRARQSELDRAQMEIINWRTVATAPGG